MTINRYFSYLGPTVLICNAAINKSINCGFVH